MNPDVCHTKITGYVLLQFVHKSHVWDLPKYPVSIFLSRNGEITLPSWKVLVKSCHRRVTHQDGKSQRQEEMFHCRTEEGSSVPPCMTGTWVHIDEIARNGRTDEKETELPKSTTTPLLKVT